jgi:hypothetical protein
LGAGLVSDGFAFTEKLRHDTITSTAFAAWNRRRMAAVGPRVEKNV